MLTEGDPAPDFYLQSALDPDAEYMLSAAAAQSPVVIAFVPSDLVTARALLDALAGIDWADVTDGVAVFGIAQDPEQGRRLATDRPFPVLLDPQGYVAGQYGLPTGPDGGPQQTLLVVDQRCTIAYAWTGEGEPPLSDVTDTVARL